MTDASNLNQGAWKGVELPRQKVVTRHEGGAVEVYAAAYDWDQLCDALIDCHRRHPDSTITTHDAKTFRDEQEGCI